MQTHASTRSRAFGHVCAVATVFFISGVTTALLNVPNLGVGLRFLISGTSTALLILAGAWYAPIADFCNRWYLKTDFRPLPYVYGDAVSLSIVYFGIHFFLRNTIAIVGLSLRFEAFYACVRDVKKVPCAERFYAFAGTLHHASGPPTFPNDLPNMVVGIILVWLMWPVILLIGVMIGGFLALKSPATYWRKALIVAFGSGVWTACSELLALVIVWGHVVWSSEAAYIRSAIFVDSFVLFVGCCAAWLIFRRLRADDLTRLHAHLALIPVNERARTITALEDLVRAADP